jgi:hypothetical protein
MAEAADKGFSLSLLVFSDDGEGFKMTAPKTVDGTTKSATIPFEGVQSVWRKIHSPRRSGTSSANSLGFSRLQTSAKWRDFEGYRAQYRAGSEIGVAEGEKPQKNLLFGTLSGVLPRARRPCSSIDPAFLRPPFGPSPSRFVP